MAKRPPRVRGTQRRLPLGLALVLALVFYAWRSSPRHLPARPSVQAVTSSSSGGGSSLAGGGGSSGGGGGSIGGSGGSDGTSTAAAASGGGSSGSSQGTILAAATNSGSSRGAVASGGGPRKAPPRTITADKPLLFFDVGDAYHHLPRCPAGWQMPGFGCDASPCPVPWDWTTNRSAADAIIFNTLNGMSGWGGAKLRDREDQWVVMWAMESGSYYPDIYNAKKNGADMNADYRLDVEVPVPYYSEWELPNINATPVAFADKRKDALLAAFISNCGAHNGRGDVLDKLIALLPGQVHSYGKCLHNREESQEPGYQAGNNRVRKHAIMQTYKFAFTPENSNDPGYVTEKLYQGLEAGVIPIYIGAPDVNRVLPVPEAIIRVDNFKSVVDLAAYMKQVAEDETLWEKHTAWKKLPQSQWSKEWQELRRMTQYSSHCRTAMHIGGNPWKWKDADQ